MQMYPIMIAVVFCLQNKYNSLLNSDISVPDLITNHLKNLYHKTSPKRFEATQKTLIPYQESNTVVHPAVVS